MVESELSCSVPESMGSFQFSEVKSRVRQLATKQVSPRCALFVTVVQATSLFVILLGAILYILNPQTHWFVYVAQGFPDPPSKFSGVWRTWGDSGQLLSEERYAEGKLEGLSTYWDWAGPKRSEKNFKGGRLDGDYVTFHTNGAVLERREYVDDLPAGHRITLHQNGMTNFEVFHSRAGARDGPEISGTATGERKVLRTWRDGQPWDGKFWSKTNGNFILRIYEVGQCILETNMGPSRLLRPGLPSKRSLPPLGQP